MYMYFMWITLFFVSCYNHLVLERKFNLEIASASFVTVIPAMLNIRPYVQIFTFFIVYTIMACLNFILDLIYGHSG